ncbi:MAG TPA: hypothetical protein VF316_03675 [Polyangiaceae bacterium]
MTAPFRDDKPAVEAALSEAERLRAEDARAAAKRRRKRALLGCLGVVALAVVAALTFAAYLFVGALINVLAHD